MSLFYAPQHLVSSGDGTYPTYYDFLPTCLIKVQGCVCLVRHCIPIFRNYLVHRKVLNKYLFLQ